MRSENLEWIQRAVGRRVNLLLAVWFAVLGPGYVLLLGLDAIGVDARIYYRGAAAWTAGSNPWDAIASYAVSYGTNYYHFAGLPTSVVLFAPATLIGEQTFVVAWVGVTCVAAAYIVRRLGLPTWWLLFPPLLEGIWSGNPGVVLVALLLAGHPVLAAIATLMKIYALVPIALLGRARAAALAIVAVIVTFMFAPALWITYVSQFGEISARLASESAGGYSLLRYPVFVPLGAGLLGLLAYYDRRTAAWVAVPALWPSSELHYGILALPVASPLFAALVAIPAREIAPFAAVVFMSVRLIRITRERAHQPVLSLIRTMDQPIASAPHIDARTPDGVMT